VKDQGVVEIVEKITSVILQDMQTFIDSAIFNIAPGKIEESKTSIQVDDSYFELTLRKSVDIASSHNYASGMSPNSQDHSNSINRESSVNRKEFLDIVKEGLKIERNELEVELERSSDNCSKDNFDDLVTPEMNINTANMIMKGIRYTLVKPNGESG
jgi:hypothetical protein